LSFEGPGRAWSRARCTTRRAGRWRGPGPSPARRGPSWACRGSGRGHRHVVLTSPPMAPGHKTAPGTSCPSGTGNGSCCALPLEDESLPGAKLRGPRPARVARPNERSHPELADASRQLPAAGCKPWRASANSPPRPRVRRLDQAVEPRGRQRVRAIRRSGGAAECAARSRVRSL
jgi:hypothetical protein